MPDDIIAKTSAYIPMLSNPPNLSVVVTEVFLKIHNDTFTDFDIVGCEREVRSKAAQNRIILSVSGDK